MKMKMKMKMEMEMEMDMDMDMEMEMGATNSQAGGMAMGLEPEKPTKKAKVSAA
jgi:hypothetical protein